MIKFYVEAICRLGRSTELIKARLNRAEGELGFASAETIALAVAGVLIAGVAYGVFRGQIDTWVSNITSGITNIGTNNNP